MTGSAIMRRVLRGALRATAAIGLPFTAHAQSVEPADDAGEVADESTATILATAERREVSLQDLSLAILVVTAEELERASLTHIHDLNSLVPALQSGSCGNASQLYI